MGYQVGTLCVPTLAALSQAQAAAWNATSAPRFVGGSCTVLPVFTAGATAGNVQFQNRFDPAYCGAYTSQVAITSQLAAPQVACSVVEVADAVTVAWAIIGGWVAVFGLKLIARAVFIDEPSGSEAKV